MDLLEIRKKAKAQKAEAKAAKGKQPAAVASEADGAAQVQAGAEETVVPVSGAWTDDVSPASAQEPTPSASSKPTTEPVAENAPSPVAEPAQTYEDDSIAHEFEAYLSSGGRRKNRNEKAPAPKEEPDLKALAEQHEAVAEERPAKGQGLDSLFLDLATEELYRHSYLTDDVVEDEEQVEVLCCTLGGEQYGIDIHRIKEIIKNRDVTEVPRAPRSIVGIITLRGRVIPVFDLRERLHLSRKELGREAKIVVVHHQQELFGLLVDAVIDVYRFPESKVESTPPVMAGVEAKYITGIGRVDDTMIIMLNLDEVLNVDSMAA